MTFKERLVKELENKKIENEMRVVERLRKEGFSNEDEVKILKNHSSYLYKLLKDNLEKGDENALLASAQLLAPNTKKQNLYEPFLMMELEPYVDEVIMLPKSGKKAVLAENIVKQKTELKSLDLQIKINGKVYYIVSKNIFGRGGAQDNQIKEIVNWKRVIEEEQIDNVLFFWTISKKINEKRRENER